MNLSKSIRPLVRAAAIVSLVAAMAGVAHARGREIVAVNAKVFNDYSRSQLPDGSFKPERYTFGEGGRWQDGAPNESVDAMTFLDIAKTIAGPLQAQGYVPAAKSDETDLLILVFWGTTAGADGGFTDTMDSTMIAMRNAAAAARAVPRGEARSMTNSNEFATNDAAQSALDAALTVNDLENRLRDRHNLANARILGYTEAFDRATFWNYFSRSQDVIKELETNRYFVVLKAYDFRHARQEKKLKLLWETRYSIRQPKNRFDEQLLHMTKFAARHFGRNTDGLIHRDLPDVQVDLGTPTVVEPPPSGNP